jgi:hypothetical protein
VDLLRKYNKGENIMKKSLTIVCLKIEKAFLELKLKMYEALEKLL